MKSTSQSSNIDNIPSSHYESLKRIKNLFSLIISRQNENSLLKNQLFSYPGFYPEIFFLKLDYFSKNNITTLDFLHYLEQHHFKFNDEIIRRFIKQYDKHGNFNLIYEDFVNMIMPWDKIYDENNNSNENIDFRYNNKDDMDDIFCEILINELKIIGLIGDLIIDIRKLNDFDAYKIFEIISNKEMYLNGEMLFQFLQGKFNTIEIKRLLYYLDSNDDGLISYDDFHDLLLPIKGDFENNEKNNEFIDDNIYENQINIPYNDNIYNNGYNEDNGSEYINNDNNRKTYYINYKINSRNKTSNPNKNQKIAFNVIKSKTKNESIMNKYLNNSEPIHEQNEIYEKESYRDENDLNENLQIKNENEENIQKEYNKNEVDIIISEKNNLNIKQNQKRNKNEINTEEQVEIKNDINNENNNNILYEQNNLNNNNNKSEIEKDKNQIEVKDNNDNNEQNNDINLNNNKNYSELDNKNNDITPNKENINNINLQQFPNTFGKNKDNGFSNPKNEIENINNQNSENTKENNNNINKNNFEKEAIQNVLSKKSINKSKKNSNNKNIINLNKQNYTYHIKSKLNLEENNSQYNDIIPPNTFDFPLIEDRNINICIKNNIIKNNSNTKNTNIIDAISIFFEYINLIIYYENRFEHLKESLSLREDLSIKEIFYLFDKDKVKYITINNFQLICNNVFKLFPTYDQLKLVFKRYKKELNLNRNNNLDSSLTRDEFFQIFIPKKSEYSSLIAKKNKIDKTKSKLSKKSKNILTELIKCLIIKESNYYKIKQQLAQNSLEYIWKEMNKCIKYAESLSKKELNLFFEEYGYFFGQNQIDIIFSIFDKDKKGLITDNDFFEEMYWQ